MTEPDMPRRLPKGCVEDLDRHDNVRIYYRAPGKPKVRLRGTPWTPEFMALYERAVAGVAIEEQEAKGTRGKPGTWRWLCQQYFTSGEYLMLSARFQIVRRNILEATFDERTKPGSPHTFADCPIADMTRKAVEILRDRKLATPEAANNRLKAMRQVFKCGMRTHEEIVKANPARDVAFFKVGSDGYYTWSIEDVLQYLERHGPGTMARRALCVLLYTGVRRSNAVRLGRQLVKHGSLRFQVHKRRREDKPKWLEIPVLPALQAELALGPQDNLTWLTTKYGKPFTSNGFGNWFKARCREAGLEQCSAHGLRKAGATIAAENGATDAQLMAIYGWETVKQASEYRKKASQKRLAQDAMKLINLTGIIVPLSPPVGQSEQKA